MKLLLEANKLYLRDKHLTESNGWVFLFKWIKLNIHLNNLFCKRKDKEEGKNKVRGKQMPPNERLRAKRDH